MINVTLNENAIAAYLEMARKGLTRDQLIMIAAAANHVAVELLCAETASAPTELKEARQDSARNDIGFAAVVTGALCELVDDATWRGAFEETTVLQFGVDGSHVPFIAPVSGVEPTGLKLLAEVATVTRANIKRMAGEMLSD